MAWSTSGSHSTGGIDPVSAISDHFSCFQLRPFVHLVRRAAFSTLDDLFDGFE